MLISPPRQKGLKHPRLMSSPPCCPARQTASPHLRKPQSERRFCGRGETDAARVPPFPSMSVRRHEDPRCEHLAAFSNPGFTKIKLRHPSIALIRFKIVIFGLLSDPSIVEPHENHRCSLSDPASVIFRTPTIFASITSLILKWVESRSFCPLRA